MYQINLSSIETKTFKTGDFERLLSKRDDNKINIDFSEIKTERLLARHILPIASVVMRERLNGIQFSLTPPSNVESLKYLRNTNLIKFIDPNEKGSEISLWHVPFLSFYDSDSQFHAVNKILDHLLQLIPFEARNQFSALEWCLSEITDNAITHAGSPNSCLTGVRYNKYKNYVVIYVSDAGLGIARTIKDAFLQMRSDEDTNAVMYGIEEHVTSKKETNFGMGLYGTYRISAHSGGDFRVISNGAEVHYKSNGQIVPMNRKINPFNGTYIEAKIDLNSAVRLKDAFLIKGKPKEYFNDYLELKYLDEETRIFAKQHAPGGTNRAHGVVMSNTLNNLLVTGKKICIDFSNFGPISSSFADEVFGKLSLKFRDINKLIAFENLSENHRDLIVDVIERRINSLKNQVEQK